MADARDNLFGETIRKARERLGFTGEDVRRLAGINPTSLSFMERGQQEPSAEQIRQLARALRLNVERLAVLSVKSRVQPRGAGEGR